MIIVTVLNTEVFWSDSINSHHLIAFETTVTGAGLYMSPGVTVFKLNKFNESKDDVNLHICKLPLSIVGKTMLLLAKLNKLPLFHSLCTSQSLPIQVFQHSIHA